MHSTNIRALLPLLLFALGTTACLDAELVSPGNTSWETLEISSEAVNRQYAVVIIDRTSSMMTRRSNGNTRCHDAVEQAITDADTFFRDEGGLGVAFWLFNGAIGIQQVGSGYYTNLTQVQNALASVDREGCQPSVTPLADALCRVASGNANGRPALSPLPGAMYVETDGMENASQGSCRGPSGAHNVPGTWQHNVFMTLFYSGIRVYTQYWHADGHISQLGDSIDIETGKPVPGVVLNAVCSTPAACESALFDELAFWTDGLYGVVADSDLEYTCAYGDCPAPKPPQ